MPRAESISSANVICKGRRNHWRSHLLFVQRFEEATTLCACSLYGNLPVATFPALFAFPKESEREYGIGRPARSWKICEPQIEFALRHCGSLFASLPAVNGPYHGRFLCQNEPQNFAVHDATERVAQAPDFVRALDRVCHIALICRLDAIEADAVVAAAHQRHVLSVRPTQRHRRAGRAAAFQSGVRQVGAIPNLFCNHAALIRKILHRLDKWPGIAPGGQLVMAAFAGQDRPATAHACAVVSAAIVLLPVAIMIVAAPAG